MVEKGVGDMTQGTSHNGTIPTGGRIAPEAEPCQRQKFTLTISGSKTAP